METRQSESWRPLRWRTAAGFHLAWVLLFAAGALAAGSSALALPRGEGVLVDGVADGRPDRPAPPALGDRIVAYIREGERVPIRNITDWNLFFHEIVPRGGCRLVATDGKRDRTLDLPPGRLAFLVRPVFGEFEESAFSGGNTLVTQGDAPAGLAAWEKLARRLSAGPEGVWLELRISEVWAQQGGGLRNALGAAGRARALAESLGLTREVASALLAEAKLQGALGQDGTARQTFEKARSTLAPLGEGLQLAGLLAEQSDWERGRGGSLRADELGRQAMALYRRMAPSCAGAAKVAHTLGTSLWLRGELIEAEAMLREALAARQVVEPSSLNEASGLNNLGGVLSDRGDLEGAEACHAKALALKERLAPGSITLAVTLNNLGLIELDRGDLSAAEEHFRRAISIREKQDPGGLDGATVYSNLALTAWARGDLAQAEKLLKEALAIQREKEPGGLALARSLNNLANVVGDRGDDDAAETHYRESLAIHQKLDPQSLDVAGCLDNLGILAKGRGDLAAAEEMQQRALEIKLRLAPESLAVANNLINLADLSRAKGDLTQAEERAQQALALYQKIAPESLSESAALHALAQTSLLRRDLPRAEALVRRALDLRGRFAPGSFYLAQSAHLLGDIAAAKGDAPASAEAFGRAVEALEAQRGHLGGGSGGAEDFGQIFAGYYRDLMEAQVRVDRAREAYHTLERARAQVFLQMLAERDLDFSRDAPAALLAEQKRLAREYDRLQAEIGGLPAAGREEKLRALLAQLATLREEQSGLGEKLRRASPGLASLEYPDPLDAARAGAALPPGTLALAYSVGQEKTLLFALGPEPGAFAAYPVAEGREALSAKVRRFRSALEQRADARPAGEALAQLLLGPAAAQLRRAKALLVLPDGPLHLLPFAALPDVSPILSRPPYPYLVESLPVHHTLSLTLYSELRRGRRTGREPLLAAFGDPDYGGERPPGARTQTPVPWTRSEVEAVCGAGLGRCEAYLGREATETRAKQLGRGVSVVHFACHGTVDERSPLDSALALATPAPGAEGDNGLLQAWEIFEGLRLDADLVVLSACETALGKEKGGEGLVGLTRAFQYAGARSVLSSLWAVSDAGTAELMRRFYRHLKEGRSQAEALRLAQLDLLRREAGPEFSDPFHWASFQLNGEGK